MCMLTLTGIVPSRAAAQWQPFQTGPMHMPAIGLLQSFQYTPSIPGPFDSTTGHWTSMVSFRWVNIWAFHLESNKLVEHIGETDLDPYRFGTFVVDMEALCLTMEACYGINDTMDVHVSIPFYTIGGGTLDGFIEGFHDLFGIDQHRRQDNGRNEARVFYIDRNQNAHLFDRDALSGTGLGDLSLYAGWLISDAVPLFAIHAGVKCPTHTRMIPSEIKGFDFYLMSSTAWDLGAARIYQGLGIIYYTDTGLRDIRFMRLRGTSATTLEYPMSDHISGIVHLIANTPSARLPRLDEFVFEMSLGLRVAWSDCLLDIGFIENIFWYDNSPDFGVYLGFKQLF